MRTEKALIAGFEPFGPYSKNVAAEIVDALDGEIIHIQDGVAIEIVGIKLPINFQRFRQTLKAALEDHNPQLAIGLGMDFKDSTNLAFETQAHTVPNYGTGIKDQEGNVGPNLPLDENPDTLEIPHLEKIRDRIQSIDGIELSTEAGRHMCESILRDLIRRSQNAQKFQPAFIHLPHTPELLAESQELETHEESRPLLEQVAIVKKTIEVLARHRILLTNQS